jgi:hypothetical protein
MDRGVEVALQNKLDAVIDLELALRARLTNTAADEPVMALIDQLAEEAQALEDILDDGAEPSIGALGPADATALQNAINKAETAIKQTDSLNNLLNAAAVLLGTVQQSKPAKAA